MVVAFLDVLEVVVVEVELTVVDIDHILEELLVADSDTNDEIDVKFLEAVDDDEVEEPLVVLEKIDIIMLQMFRMVEIEVFEYAQIYLELINVLLDDEVDEQLLVGVIDVDVIDDEMVEHIEVVLVIDVQQLLVEVVDDEVEVVIDEMVLVDY